MKKPVISFVIVWAAASLFLCCSRGSCPLAGGSEGSEIRNLEPFTTIVLYGKVNLILTQDSTQQVTVSGGKSLFPGITTVVDGQTLTIRDNNTCLLTDPSSRVNIHISGSALQKITYYGAGDVSSTNTLHAPLFTVDSWEGSGTIRLDLQATEVDAIVRNENATLVLTGAADTAYIYCGEAGSVDMSGLTTAATHLDSKTVRDIFVDATRTLHANIVYRGNVYYKNEPVLDTLITGTGKLIHIP